MYGPVTPGSLRSPGAIIVRPLRGRPRFREALSLCRVIYGLCFAKHLVAEEGVERICERHVHGTSKQIGEISFYCSQSDESYPFTGQEFNQHTHTAARSEIIPQHPKRASRVIRFRLQNSASVSREIISTIWFIVFTRNLPHRLRLDSYVIIHADMVGPQVFQVRVHSSGRSSGWTVCVGSCRPCSMMATSSPRYSASSSWDQVKS